MAAPDPISAEQARQVIAAGEARAGRLGVPVILVVLDAGAWLKALARMDGALLGSIDIAVGKARTAALFGVRSEAVWEWCKPGTPGESSLQFTNGGLVPFAGGIPLKAADGRLLGAVGVSGGAVAQDLEIAEAAAAALVP